MSVMSKEQKQSAKKHTTATEQIEQQTNKQNNLRDGMPGDRMPICRTVAMLAPCQSQRFAVVYVEHGRSTLAQFVSGLAEA